MTNYRMFSNVLKYNLKNIKNLHLNKTNKIFIKNELELKLKEPQLNISIMDNNYSKKFWEMNKIYEKKNK